MNPVLDQFAVAVIVAGAIAYFVRRYFRKRAGAKACGSDCGCGAAKAGKLRKS